MSTDFHPFPKIPRWNREVVITEKIDGTNASIIIKKEAATEAVPFEHWTIQAAARNGIISQQRDNHGFAKWVSENAAELIAQLGEGHHFGEWMGQGINRNYGLKQKHFVLFNIKKHAHLSCFIDESNPQLLYRIPAMYTTLANDVGAVTQIALNELKTNGSKLVPSYMNPEGVVLYHSTANKLFKVTLENDEQAKGQTQQQTETRSQMTGST